MPQGATAVVSTRPRLGFSIESLVGGGGGTDEKRRSLSPPCNTKMPESPPSSLHEHPFFQREILLAREQTLREQMIRDQIIREHLSKEPSSREQVQRDLQALVDRSASPLTSPNRSASPLHYDDESPISKKPTTPPTSPISSLQNIHPLIPSMGINLPPHLLSIGTPGSPHHPLNSPLMHHQLLAQQQMQHLSGTPLPPVPGPREYPLYPWLMSRHAGRMMAPGFPGKLRIFYIINYCKIPIKSNSFFVNNKYS